MPRIDELAAAAALTGAEMVPVRQGTSTVRTTITAMFTNPTIVTPNITGDTSLPPLRFRGAWAATTAYLAGDVVSAAGAFWLAPNGFTSGTTFVADRWLPFGGGVPIAATGNFAVPAGTGGTTALTANRLYYTPFEGMGGAIDRIGLGITVAGVAGTVVRIGVMGSLANGAPGRLLFEAGAIPGDATQDTLAAMLTVAQSLPFGRGWFATVAQGGAPTVRSLSAVPVQFAMPGTAATALSPAGLYEDGVTGALPANAATSLSVASTVPRPQVRYA